MPNPMPPTAKPMNPLDPGSKMADIARKAASMTKDQMGGVKKQADDAKDEKKKKTIATPNAKRWLERIERSKKAKKSFLEDAERFFRMYQGDYSERPGRKRTQDKMSVNIVYSHVEIVTPAVFSGFPAVRVQPKPKVGENSDQAQIRANNMKLVLTHWAKELALDDELREVFFDTFFGLAALEVGWETVIEEIDEMADPEEGGEAVSLGSVVSIKDQPFAVRRDFRNIYLDDEVPRRKDGRWIAVEEVIPFNDFLASPTFTDKAKKRVKPQERPNEEQEEKKNWMGRDEQRSEKSWLQIFTIWDKETRKKYVVTKDYPGYLNSDGPEGEEWPYEIDYKGDIFPICIHDAKKDRFSPYSWSEFKAYEPQIVELNRIRQAIQIHVKRALPRIIFTESAGKKDQVQKLMNSRTDEATMLESISEQAIKPFANAQIPPDLYKFNEIAKDDLLNVSSLFEYQNSSIANTATEASIIEGRSNVRKAMRTKLWEQYVVEIFAKMAQLCQQNMDESVAIQIAGPQGIEWLHVTKEEIQGDYFFDIEPGVMEYKNEDMRKQQLLKFAELSQGDPNVNRRALLMKLADLLDMQPEDVILSPDQIPPPPPPPPTIKFREIDVMAINDSAIQNAVLIEAMKENGMTVSPEIEAMVGAAAVKGQPGGGPPPPHPGPGGQGSLKGLPGGKNMGNPGSHSPNGNPSAPPVQGNLNAGGNPAG
jgi:hypothetical protein